MRVNEEIKRDNRIVGILPNDVAIARMVVAVLPGQDEHWQLKSGLILSAREALETQAIHATIVLLSQFRTGVMGGKQLGFSDYELTTAKKQAKREKCLAEMEAVVPWQALIALIKPHYPKASKKGGRPPYPL